jgi:hypothetical protein
MATQSGVGLALTVIELHAAKVIEAAPRSKQF